MKDFFNFRLKGKIKSDSSCHHSGDHPTITLLRISCFTDPPGETLTAFEDPWAIVHLCNTGCGSKATQIQRL
jgi:hypothetical protein